MTKEEKDKILKLLADNLNDYIRYCEKNIAVENGKLAGAEYMVQRFLDIINTDNEVEK